MLGCFAIHIVALVLMPVLHKDIAKSPQLAAHFLVCLAAFLAFAVFGTALWFSGPSASDTCGSDHITGYCEGNERITLMMMAFQTYEVLLALYVPKLRGPSGDAPGGKESAPRHARGARRARRHAGPSAAQATC